MKRIGKALSVLLALTLLMSCLPLSVFAADGLPFRDVSSGDWFYDELCYVYENGLMKGTSGDRFSPGVTTSRGMIVTILYRMEGEPTTVGVRFADVAADAYYADAVAWASSCGIVNGYGNSIFAPDDPITRQQFAAILYRYASYKGASTEIKGDCSEFADCNEVGAYALDAMNWALGVGLMNGVGAGRLDPNGSATRAQAAVLLTRFITSVPDDEQREFVPKTIHDFPAELVINFDEDETTNFGVLNENVIRWEDSRITAEKIYDGAETRYVFSDGEAVAGVPLGSVVYVRGEDGTPYLVSFGSVDGSIVTPSKELPLSAYYTYLDAAIVTEIDTAAIERGSMATYSARQARSNGVTFSPNYENGIDVGAVLDGEHFKLGLTGSVTCKSDGHIKYDAVWLGKDYIDFMMESSLKFSAELTGEVKAAKTLHSLNEDLEVGEVPLVTIIPGLDLTLEVKLPVKVDAKVGFTGGLELSKTERVEYMNHFKNPVHTSVEEKSDVTIDCKGEVELKAGIAAEIGADFLDDLLELVLELKLFGVVRATPEFPEQDASENPASLHFCTSCIRGELLGEVSGEIKLQANISEKTKLELVTITLLKLEIPIDAFYVSLGSAEDSVHAGQLTFGFGSCPNQKWRVSFITRLFDGSLLTDPFVVEIKSEEMEETLLAVSTEYAYLFDGTYTAAVERGGKLGEPVSFTVKGFPEEVTLYSAKVTEKEIYTAYLTEGGYEELVGTIAPEDRANLDIYTVFTDFDGNGIKDLLLRCSRRTLEPSPEYRALYTIDGETDEVIQVISTEQVWQGYDNEAIDVWRNEETRGYALILESIRALDEERKCQIRVETVMELCGDILVAGDSYRKETFYMYPNDEYGFADTIEAMKEGPHTIDAKNNTITAYYVNDAAVTKEAYNEAYVYSGDITNSNYKWFWGLYYTPIK